MYGPSNPQSRTIYTLEYFQTLQLNTHWREHNIALKFLREVAEAQQVDRLWMDFGPMEISKINHPKGTAFSFHPTAGFFKWEWQQMVAQLHTDYLQNFVEGSGGRSRGIIGCSLHKTDMHDMKRHRADVENKTAVAGVVYYTWDFVVWRADGSYIAMHPNYSSTKIDCKTHWPVWDGELPRTGKGGTSGRGTFQYFIKKQVDFVACFDAWKPTTGTRSRSHVGQNAPAAEQNAPAAQQDAPAVAAQEGRGSASSWQ